MNGISISGLAPEHQARIREIGLWAWMDEQANPQPPVATVSPASKAKPALKNLTRHRRECVVCGRTFYSRRSDARYHSAACRVKGHRRGVSVRCARYVTLRHQ
jgi:hypothetical protein